MLVLNEMVLLIAASGMSTSTAGAEYEYEYEYEYEHEHEHEHESNVVSRVFRYRLVGCCIFESHASG